MTLQMRSMTISLDGLLDYDEEDREECTFEVTSLSFTSIYNPSDKLIGLCEALHCSILLWLYVYE